MKANEEWRNDPLRRNKARALCAEKARLYAKLLKDVESAQITLYRLQHLGEQRPDGNLFTTTNFMSLIKNYKFMLDHYANPTETLIGNIAAFEEMDNYV